MAVFCGEAWRDAMIPIRLEPEPANFNADIRVPGMQFLAHVPSPGKRDWKENELWRKCLRDLYDGYKGICAYIGIWIIYHDATVDHFLPKSKEPQVAYEWRNYRLSCGAANLNKADYDILDPFQIQYDWFLLDFPSHMVKGNPNLQRNDLDLVNNTIDILKLNSEYFIQDRLNWTRDYVQSLNFDHLKKYAPFIAYELQRQNLVREIIQIMHFHPPE